MSKKLMISLSAVFALFVMCVVLVLVSCEKPLISDENDAGASAGEGISESLPRCTKGELRLQNVQKARL